ncbi:hypothetical protein P7C70_g3089, partial [Phenoliferia sp. Uapishka_3]
MEDEREAERKRAELERMEREAEEEREREREREREKEEKEREAKAALAALKKPHTPVSNLVAFTQIAPPTRGTTRGRGVPSTSTRGTRGISSSTSSSFSSISSTSGIGRGGPPPTGAPTGRVGTASVTGVRGVRGLRSRVAVRDTEKVAESAGRILSDEEWEASSEHPRNWETRKRWKNALIIAFTGFLSTTGSSIFVPATSILRVEFGQPHEVVVLTTALYVLGLGSGPFLFAPVSELYGRQVAYTLSMIGFTFLNLGCAFATNLPGLVVLRFLAGCFGSSGPGLGVATISDLYETHIPCLV